MIEFFRDMPSGEIVGVSMGEPRSVAHELMEEYKADAALAEGDAFESHTELRMTQQGPKTYHHAYPREVA